MNLLFLCGSLEAGRDGVGDYTQALARACRARGHDCRLVAIADKHLGDRAEEEWPERLRLPAALPWSERTERLRRWLAGMPVDWTSWQLVPYALHPKGIVPAAVRRALVATAHATPGRRHAMVHELWIGLSRGEPWRARLIGWFQQRAWRALLTGLRPDILHTSNPAYRHVLRDCGFAAERLPLPGNVPPRPVSADEARAALGRALGTTTPPTHDTRPLVGVIFGTVHPQWNPQPTLEWLRTTAAILQRAPTLLFAGRLGRHGEALVAQLRSDPSHGVHCVATGERTTDELSALLQGADYGLGLHPWAIVGKSAAVTDLLEHGLPVLVPRDDWQLRRGATPPPTPHRRLARLSDVPPERAADFLARREPPRSTLAAIAEAFLADLAAAHDRVLSPPAGAVAPPA